MTTICVADWYEVTQGIKHEVLFSRHDLDSLPYGAWDLARCLGGSSDGGT